MYGWLLSGEHFDPVDDRSWPFPVVCLRTTAGRTGLLRPRKPPLGYAGTRLALCAQCSELEVIPIALNIEIQHNRVR